MWVYVYRSTMAGGFNVLETLQSILPGPLGIAAPYAFTASLPLMWEGNCLMEI